MASDFAYRSMPEQREDSARDYLLRASAYRKLGLEGHARGCERKALKKFEQSFGLRHMLSMGKGPDTAGILMRCLREAGRSQGAN